MITAVVTELVSGLTTFLAGIAGGMVELVETLFWDPTLNANAGGLTSVGLVIILFMGIGVAYFIIGKVLRLLRA